MVQEIPSNIFTEMTVEELSSISRQFPYFATPHFYLFKKLQPGSDEWKSEAQKAALFYSPFHLTLLSTSNEAEIPEESEFTQLANADYVLDEVSSVAADLVEADTFKLLDTDLAAEETETIVHENQQLEEGTEEQVYEDDIAPTLATYATEASGQDQIEEEVNEREIENTIIEVQLNASNEEKMEATEDVADVPLFEPLHTSDYFASQGIKIVEESQPTDKLGKQLRSFTQWLQTMKKMPGTEQSPGTQQEQAVRVLAEKSNKDEDVVTEAMAHAYHKQGKQQKAREVYEKLKLLYPDKSGYFAAKINEL